MKNNLKSAALILAGTLGGVTSAIAGVSGVIDTVVTPLSSQVTYSSLSATNPLVTYVGYLVTVSNIGSNTVNSVTFKGTVTVTDLHESALFSPPADGASCSTTTKPLNAPVNAVTISCSLGQMSAGTSTSFAVFFGAPAQDTGSPLPANTDFVQFAGVTNYSEGTNDNSSSNPNDSFLWLAVPDVLLGTNNPELVKSALPKSGGKFFTGNGAAATPVDPFATSVTVPPTTTYSRAEIQESDVTSSTNCSSYGNFYNCYQSAITIPSAVFGSGSGSYLTIILRMDAAKIKKGTKIDRVLIQYEGDDSNLTTVGPCATPTTPNADSTPCIANRVHYKNSRVDGWSLERDGDFEWTLINLKNGSYRVF